MTAPAADRLLGDRYRLTSRVAAGGMGEVWRALDEMLGREVAVKIMRREYADDPTFLARFRAEARHAAGLSHTGIATVYDFGEGAGDDDSPFLVMELVPGEPLSAIVAREGALPPDRTLDIVGQAALGLQAAHDAGVVHRDVKPGNILVTPEGTVKITDFGIARAADSVPITQTGAIMGTAYYISPEQASGGSVTPASDLYSLGIVAYECLTGRRPFSGDTPVGVALAQIRDEPPSLPETVPAPARDLVMGLLAKEPRDRPASAGEVGRRALALGPTLGVAAEGSGPVEATRVLALDDVEGAAGSAYPSAGPPYPSADTDPGFHLPLPSRTPSWLPAAVTLAAGAVLLLLLLRACGGEDVTTVPTGDESSAASAPTSLEIVAEDYLGRPLDDVRTELEELGLRVDVVHTAGGGTVGTVKAVAPTGVVAADSVVELTVVAAQEDEDSEEREDREERGDDDKPGKGKGKGRG